MGIAVTLYQTHDLSAQFRVGAVFLGNPFMHRCAGFNKGIKINLVEGYALRFKESGKLCFFLCDHLLFPDAAFHGAFVKDVAPLFRNGLIYVFRHEHPALSE